MVSSEKIKLVQELLNKYYGQELVVDGIMGKGTIAAMSMVSVIPVHWDDSRKVIGCIQYFCLREGFDAGLIDGLWGSQTEYAFNLLQLRDEGGQIFPWRTDEGVGGKVEDQSSLWPLQTQEELIKFYGHGRREAGQYGI